MNRSNTVKKTLRPRKRTNRSFLQCYFGSLRQFLGHPNWKSSHDKTSAIIIQKTKCFWILLRENRFDLKHFTPIIILVENYPLWNFEISSLWNFEISSSGKFKFCLIFFLILRNPANSLLSGRWYNRKRLQLNVKLKAVKDSKSISGSLSRKSLGLLKTLLTVRSNDKRNFQ